MTHVPPAPPLAPSLARLAIVCPSWVGDTVMCTPVLRACHRCLPSARITAICRPGLDDLLAGLLHIDSTIVCDMKGLFGPQRLGKAIKQSAAQAVLLLPNSFRSAISARLSGVPIRVGYDRDGRGALLTHAFAPGKTDRPVAMVDYYARLAAFALGIDVSAMDVRLELATTPREQAAADALLHDVAGPFVVLNPGANRADKRWPPERFAAVAQALARGEAGPSTRPAIVLSGAPSESDVLQAVEKHAAGTPMINLASRGVTLASLKAVLHRAALLITNDTGPRHIAAAFGTPTITLFGPTDHRWTTLHGLESRERLLLAEPFLPEELEADGQARPISAIDRIAVEDVVSAARALLPR